MRRWRWQRIASGDAVVCHVLGPSLAVEVAELMVAHRVGVPTGSICDDCRMTAVCRGGTGLGSKP